MRKAALYLPLGIGAALLVALGLWKLVEADSHQPTADSPEQTAAGAGPTVKSRQPTADSDRLMANSEQPTASPEVTRAIDRAIQAAAKRDAGERAAAVTELKTDPRIAVAAIETRMREAKNPEYLRQLDMLSKEVRAP